MMFENQHYKKKPIINGKIVSKGHEVYREKNVVHKVDISLKNMF